MKWANRDRREARKAAIDAYKVEKGCVDCGYRQHAEALDFDHLPGTKKEFSIAKGYGRVSAARLWDEIEKCEVVCANCHRVRTAMRRK